MFEFNYIISPNDYFNKALVEIFKV